jgi:uncharacterized protein YpbB
MKLRNYGAAVLAEIRAHLEAHPRLEFPDVQFATDGHSGRTRGEVRMGSAGESLRLHREGRRLDEIARMRQLAVSTIAAHLAEAAQTGEVLDWSQFFSAEQAAELRPHFEKHGGAALSPIYEALGSRVDYATLRLFRAAWETGQLSAAFPAIVERRAR